MVGIGVLVLLMVALLLVVVARRVLPHRSKGARSEGPVATMVVLGSGGHTTEMMTYVRALDRERRYVPRHYVVAETDAHSRARAEEAERGSAASSYDFAEVPRSREVGQSYMSSVPSTLWSLLFCVRLVFRIRPRLLLVNGPGTCVPVCAAALLLRALTGHPVRIVFVESLARVQDLSLSGKLLRPFADEFFVQWPALHARYPGTQYAGRLC